MRRKEWETPAGQSIFIENPIPALEPLKVERACFLRRIGAIYLTGCQ